MFTIKALERLADTPNEELARCLKAMSSEDRKQIARQVETSLPDAERFAREFTKQPDQHAAVRKAADRLRHLRKGFPPEKFALAVTWLITASGMVTTLAAPATMPEINSQVATLGLGIAITVALKSKNKDD